MSPSRVTSAQSGNVDKYQVLLSSLETDLRPTKRRKHTHAHGLHHVSNAKLDQQEREHPVYDELENASQERELDVENEQIEDPFNVHFEESSLVDFAHSLSAIKESKWVCDRRDFAPDYSIWSYYPDLIGGPTIRQSGRPSRRDRNLSLKKKLQVPAARELANLEPVLHELSTLIFNYEDTFFPHRTPQSASILRHLTCIHILNHLLKTRDRIIKNNERLSKEASDTEIEHRDQGFTRPTVLILLPTRQACVRYVDALVTLYTPEQQENRKRFQESFSSPTGDLSSAKPDDFRELFEGNDDDLFRIGIKLTRKTIKLFSKFYNSDIILASPLGLRIAMGKAENKTQDYDFLSSIEVLLLDQADALFMQNWDHVEYIVEHLGLQPREAHGCDFSRVRNWYLDGNAKFIRQTIALAAYNFAPLNKLFTHDMNNHAGKHKILQQTNGVIAQLSNMPRQTLSRLQFSKVLDEPEERFKYFTQVILPKVVGLAKSPQSAPGVLVFVPKYTEFLRIRNYIAAAPDMQDISFGAISEYTPVKQVARARTHFISGRYSLMLYTERVHHFRRYQLKGVKRIVMYGLPDNPVFYREMVEDFLNSALAIGDVRLRELDVRVIFSRLDVLKLEPVVGTGKHLSLLREDEDIFEFVG